MCTTSETRLSPGPAVTDRVLTVIGNLAVDRVDGGPPSPGGCPSFAGAALAKLGAAARIVTQRAPRDAALFSEMLAAIGAPTVVLDSDTTSAFELVYRGESRTMSVIAPGDPWTPAHFQADPIDSSWVHLAPLLRSDFPPATVAALSTAGRRLSLDGQGLVRAPRLGPMVTDGAYDPTVLEHLTTLKLADDEAAIVAAGALFDEADADRLGVPEILVTFGSAGADVYLNGARTHVCSNRRIEGVHTTGSGDMFAVSYAAARAAGTDPVQAAHAACELVADVLERRRLH
jgi:sugar/nucleoside kinase (ribokinase family)